MLTLKRSGSALAMAGALTLLLASCSGAGSGSGSSGSSGSAGDAANNLRPAKEGGHLTVALAEQPDALDPTVAGTYVGRVVLVNMCEKLYDVDKGLNLVPELAASMPQISDGGKTYTIKLRQGVTFNDGTPLDAQAVMTTLNRNLHDKLSNRAESLSSIKTVAVVDPMTVKLTLSAPYAPLTSVLAARAGMIESPTQLKKLGDNFAAHPVCVGPFSFVSRPSGDQIELEKSQYYYEKSKVHLDKVTFKAVTQPNVRVANLRSGDVQVVDRINPSDVQSLKSSQNLRLDSVTSLGYQAIVINVANSNGAGSPPYHQRDTPLAQQKLRTAFELSLDRDAINKVVYNGQYAPDCSPISQDSPYRTDTVCSKHDVAQAKKLIAETGISTPIPVELTVKASDSLDTKLGTVIQSMAKEAGFDVSVRPTEYTTALDQAKAGKFDTFAKKWSGRLDPDQNISPFWSPNSGTDYTGADYQDVNKLMEQGRETSDDAQRKQIYGQLVKALNEHLNNIYLLHPKFILGIGSNVTDVQYYGDTLIRLKTAGFAAGS